MNIDKINDNDTPEKEAALASLHHPSGSLRSFGKQNSSYRPEAETAEAAEIAEANRKRYAATALEQARIKAGHAKFKAQKLARKKNRQLAKARAKRK